ncbi:choice-of-anchor Q domain-containing protein [Dokdonella soli]|uniref:Right-handed parallel beta-helix repeat-containing protein n=1 Tax=Dokdonella soli TaxID=529810 RepID=A0ABN1ICN0_9GAMM
MHSLRPTRIAACLSAIFSLAAAAKPGFAATHLVTSCDDSASAATTPGTLRFEIGAAADTDIVDLSTLTSCSTITLHSGEIHFAVPNLSIVSSSSNRKTISGNLTNRVFNHAAAGTLEVDYLTITAGRYQAAAAAGGCIISGGTVVLTGSTVTGCAAKQTPAATLGNYAQGGGVFARKGMQMSNSVISGNVADAGSAPNSGGAQGGGVFVGQLGGVPSASNLAMKYSTLENNSVTPPPPGSGHDQNWGGGAFVAAGSLSLKNSTVNGNYAPSGGGLYQTANGQPTTVLISNSTISGNTAKGSGAGSGVGGLQVAGPLQILNSTIALNNGNVGGVRGSTSTTIQSSIIATNISDFQPLSKDFYQGNVNLSGTDNLIQSIGISPLPSGFITVTSDPQLVPLGNHGGHTMTHALLASSPALGMGNNSANLSVDQRGIGYSRPPTSPDIGAYQRQVNDDELFYDGFDR